MQYDDCEGASTTSEGGFGKWPFPQEKAPPNVPEHPAIPEGRTRVGTQAVPSNPTTGFLTATTFIYALGAGITAAAGTRLALQLVLSSGYRYNPLQSLTHVVHQSYYFSSLPRHDWHWAICAPAADHSHGCRFSGTLSGIEPQFSVTRQRQGSPLHYHQPDRW